MCPNWDFAFSSSCNTYGELCFSIGICSIYGKNKVTNKVKNFTLKQTNNCIKICFKKGTDGLKINKSLFQQICARICKIFKKKLAQKESLVSFVFKNFKQWRTNLLIKEQTK